MSRRLFPPKFQLAGVNRWRIKLRREAIGVFLCASKLCVQANSWVCVLVSEAWITKHRFLFGQWKPLLKSSLGGVEWQDDVLDSQGLSAGFTEPSGFWTMGDTVYQHQERRPWPREETWGASGSRQHLPWKNDTAGELTERGISLQVTRKREARARRARRWPEQRGQGAAAPSGDGCWAKSTCEQKYARHTSVMFSWCLVQRG